MPAWTYNEFRHLGVDFSDPNQVATYERRQGTRMEYERKLVARLEINHGHRVVDFGCGTGAFVIAAAETGAEVVGVDISPAMLGFAARKVREAGVTGISFNQGSFLSFDQPAESADFVVTKFALHHLPDAWKVAALRRIWKSLRRGGVFYLQDVVFSFHPDEQEEKLEAWIDASVKNGSFSRGEFETHIRDEFSTYSVLMEQMLRLAGFEAVTANYPSAVQAEYVCAKR